MGKGSKGKAPHGKSRLEIVPPSGAVDIQYFTGEKEPGTTSRFKGGRINVLKHNPTDRDHGLFQGAYASHSGAP